jgi:hypothetical protein
MGIAGITVKVQVYLDITATCRRYCALRCAG